MAALVWLLAAVEGAAGVPPSVSNVTLTQRVDGSGIADVVYDLQDPDGDSLTVSLQASLDGGATWDFPVLNATGDIGDGVQPGVGRLIEWDLGGSAEPVVAEDVRVRVVASDVGTDFPAQDRKRMAIIDFSKVDWSDEANIEKYSRAGLCHIMASRVWSGGSYGDIDVVAGLKTLNPDIKVIGYVSVKSAQLSGALPTADGFWRTWYDRTRPYWAYTVTGDTVQDWPGNVVLNILDADCRRVMIETIVEYQRTSLNTLDGVFWDYFNTELWIPDFVEVDGDPDLDGDGIGHWTDVDELAAYRAAEVNLVEALRDSLGEGFIQIFNGQRSYRDRAFAGLADGVIFELFPTLHFPDPDMASALDPDYAHNLWNIGASLRTRNGGPYLVLTNPWRNFYYDEDFDTILIDTGDQFRAVALVADAVACWSTESNNTFDYRYGWPDVPVSLGAPLGPAVFEDPFIRRAFEYGRVEIEMKSGSYPNPFDYRIWALGQLVEELAIPYRYP